MPGEPLYLPEDLEAVLEWQQEQDLLCPGCGQPRDETMDPELQNAYRARALRCHACAAKARKAASFGDKGLEAMFFSVERIHD